MARKPDEHMALPVTEQFAQDGARFDTLLMDMAKVLFTQWLHAEEQRRGDAMRRKNGMDRKHRAGLYLRLSKEDEAQGQSGSISNQRAILERYAQDQGWEVAGCYIDDGYSGLHFDRPGFQRLLSDIEAGLVNLVLTKDLSRLGRDYIDTGYYLERYFPSRQVRYIALADGIDTFASSSAQMIWGPLNRL